jgi:hypothetical protein
VFRKHFVVGLLCIALLAMAFSVGGVVAPKAATALGPPHIMLIVEENTSFGSIDGSPFIIGNPHAPYFNSLATKFASAQSWFAVEHNSPKDYLDLLSGSNHAGERQPFKGQTLVDELAAPAKSIPWKAYMEGAPSPCYLGSGAGLNHYSKTHNPFVDFASIVKNPAQCGNVVPFSHLSADLNSASPPAFAWVTPNECDDMHSACGGNAIAHGDAWLQTNLQNVVLKSSWFANGGIVIITFDEGASADTQNGTLGTGGHIATLVISAKSSGPFNPAGNHFGVLRGIEQAYGVGLLAHSADPANGNILPAFG